MLTTCIHTYLIRTPEHVYTCHKTPPQFTRIDHTHRPHTMITWHFPKQRLNVFFFSEAKRTLPVLPTLHVPLQDQQTEPTGASIQFSGWLYLCVYSDSSLYSYVLYAQVMHLLHNATYRIKVFLYVSRNSCLQIFLGCNFG